VQFEQKMRLFILLEIGHPPKSNEGMPFLRFASSLSSDLVGTGIDDASESAVVDLVLKLIVQADKVFLFVNINDTQMSLGETARILDHVTPPIVVVLKGHHDQAELILGRFGNKLTRVNNNEEIKRLIERFAQ
jgi:hypothetical protein